MRSICRQTPARPNPATGGGAPLTPGEQVEVTLVGSVAGPTGVGSTDNVELQAILTDGLEYLPPAAGTPGAPDSILDIGGGQTLLVWMFGTVAHNSEVGPVTFKARASDDVGPSTNQGLIIGAIDGDTAVPQSAEAKRTLAFVDFTDGYSNLTVEKTPLTPLIAVGDTVRYQLEYTNSGRELLPSARVVDVLPFVGDARAVASSFSGATALESVTVENGETILYTAAPPQDVQPDGTIPAAFAWCEQVDFGTASCQDSIDQTTAIQVVSGPLAANSPARPITVAVGTSGNTIGDIYANDHYVDGSGFAFLAQSPLALAQVADPRVAISKKVAQTTGSTIFIEADASDGRQGAATTGDAVTYEIAVSNPGNAPLQSLVVNDPAVPACNRQVGSLAPGENSVFRCTVPAGGPIPATNIATVTGRWNGPGAADVSASNSARVTVTTPPAVRPTRRAWLHVAKRGPRVAQAGGRVKYRIVVRNRGRLTARNVVVRDRLPRGLVFDRISRKVDRRRSRARRARMSGGTLVWKIGNLKPGKRKVIIVNLKVAKTSRSRMVNRVVVRSRNASTVRAKRATRVRVPRVKVLPAVTG